MTMIKRILGAAAGAAALAGTSAWAGGEPPLTTELVANGLERPIFATYAPGDSTRLFVIEKRGRIRVVNLKTGELLSQPFLDIDSIVGGGTSTNSEQGLLGLAFHPDYQNNGYFYVNFTNNAGNTNVRRYQVSDDPNVADTVGATLLTIDQPFSNHNGGWLGFGPDGYLYIATGDGGAGGDPLNNGQSLNTLLGKMLRIDVDSESLYDIPTDNPFADGAGEDEIWAYGLRNPWRASFDRLTGDFYIADVGQNAIEEVNVQPADSTGGENYGWRCYEGDAAFNLAGCASASTMAFPIHTYPHVGQGPFKCSVTGGYVYRGCAIPGLDGTYFFADYCSSEIFSLVYEGKDDPPVTNRTSELDPPGIASISSITSFGEDMRGELYICDQNGGEIFRIIPETPIISPADLDCSGAVDVSDLLEMLSSWGGCIGCVSDLTGDDFVSVDDLLQLLGEWG